MKKIASMMSALIVVVATLFAAVPANATETKKESSAISTIISAIPSSIVVEQTATLGDGRQICVYYKKTGDICEVFSENNLKGYGVDDLLSLRSTSFRIVSDVKGKRVYHTTVGNARKLVKRLVNAYL